ncbi:MAG: cobalamin biosynthesis protein CobW [Eubacterium sp.]|nr:cobalamin biosynthesis protein CobW [Eubacterium sp.]MCI8917530.1 cobalamin biosynthesis protein CobW [Eubacterium sp.]
MTKIDIISGFLGAGKTTLIKKMIEEVFKGQKIVLIENEFGEIGIDGGFLKDAGIEITEMNSGCICCTLVGDFDKNLKEVLEKFHPERILIEPSGVGKLSDVMKSVIDLEKERDVKLNGLVTVVNAAKASKQMKAFGEFFNNQIEFASTIVLSRSQNVSAQKLELCVKQMQELNPKAAIITTPWDEISAEAILKVIEQTDSLEMELMAEARHAQEAAEHAHHHHDHNGHCDHGHDDHEHHACGHCHDEHGHAHHDDEHAHHNSEDGCTHAHHDSEDGCTHACHDGDSGHAHTHHDSSHAHTHHDSSRAPHTEECHEHHHADEGHSCCDHSHDGSSCCGHDHGHDHHEHHHADEVFMSWGKETPHKYEKSVIEHALKVLSETEEYGTILRAKGMVESVDGSWIYFDMVPGEYELRQGQPEYTGRLCVIGCSLAEERLLDLFEI